MADYRNCMKCGAELHDDDIAIHRKLINRGAEEFYCIDCLAEHFGCGRADIEGIIDYYRKSGKCTLFR